MRTTTPATRRSQPVPSGGWWQAALFIPVGYASTRFIGDGAPLLAMVLLTAALAGIFRVIPGLVEVVVGGGGFVATMYAALDGPGCGAMLGEGGTPVVLVFGAVMGTSAFVRLLGSGNPREMARHLLVATAALELALFAVTPAGRALTGVQDSSTIPVVVAAVLIVATLVGCRARANGFPLLGIGLVSVLGTLALAGSPCSGHPSASLAGSVTFALVSLFLTSTNDDLDTDEYRPHEHPFVTT